MAFAQVGSCPPRPGELYAEPIHLACLALNYPDGRLSPQDIAEELLRLPTRGRVAGIAYTAGRSEGERNIRAFLREDGKLYSTTLVDVRLPGSRATHQIRTLAQSYAAPGVADVIAALSAEGLHRRFHEEVSTWFLRTAQRRNELRHLVRVLFVWLLQERGVIPEDALWRPGLNWHSLPEGCIHKHILWLFNEVLATPDESRALSGSRWHEELRRTVPFLNGSMFAELKSEDQPQVLTNAQYVDLKQGLFSILGRYDWTLSDRTGYATESAIDASMLGELFERLVLVTDGPRIEPDGHIKMPGGTYYTPQDIADEMVTDALAGWTERKVGGSITLHELFHPAPQSTAWMDLTPDQVCATLSALTDVNILDPCCGSGAFTVAVLQGLWRARTRIQSTLNPGHHWAASTDSLEKIIEHNLFATDIHPLAVLITRLRIFIALVDMRREDVKPLPNLDTRIIAANTLCINVGDKLTIGNPEINKLIEDLGALREAWTTAHRPKDKKAVLKLERATRSAIREMATGWVPENELEWLDVDLLYPAAPPANIDARLLFPKPDGWDIVIGNPPYQRPDEADKNRGQRLSYIGARTNLYLMFIEAALEVARPSGCVTLIVPHSLVFGRSPKSIGQVRDQVERYANHVDIRTYDNGPQPAFPRLPWLKQGSGKTNRQRVTIVRMLLSEPVQESTAASVYSRGLLRLTAENRLRVLRARYLSQLQPQTSIQWTQAPTPELVQLLRLMRGPKRKLPHGRGATISKSAMYFITCLPEGRLHNPSRKEFLLADDGLYWPWIGLYNSHLFYAYWLMVGNHMDVTANTYLAVHAPRDWKDMALLQETADLARELTSPPMVARCRNDHTGKGGKIFPNCDFHSHPEAASLIEELDLLLLRAYGLPAEPLLYQMRTIRTGSAHHLTE